MEIKILLVAIKLFFGYQEILKLTCDKRKSKDKGRL